MALGRTLIAAAVVHHERPADLGDSIGGPLGGGRLERGERRAVGEPRPRRVVWVGAVVAQQPARVLDLCRARGAPRLEALPVTEERVGVDLVAEPVPRPRVVGQGVRAGQCDVVDAGAHGLAGDGAADVCGHAPRVHRGVGERRAVVKAGVAADEAAIIVVIGEVARNQLLASGGRVERGVECAAWERSRE